MTSGIFLILFVGMGFICAALVAIASTLIDIYQWFLEGGFGDNTEQVTNAHREQLAGIRSNISGVGFMLHQEIDIDYES